MLFSFSTRLPQYAGGFFTAVGTIGASHMAAWIGCDTPAATPGDLDGDGAVNGFDLALLLGQWTGAAAYAPCPPIKPADLNSDCKINGFDLAILLGAWG